MDNVCLEIFDDDGNGEVDFKEFIQVMFIIYEKVKPVFYHNLITGNFSV